MFYNLLKRNALNVIRYLTFILLHEHKSAKTYLIHLFIYSPPEDGHNKQGGDGRCQVASDGLNVVKQLSTTGGLNDRNPHNAQGH